MTRGNLRVRLFLLILPFILPGIILMIYSMNTQQGNEIFVAAGIAVWFIGYILLLKDTKSVIELSKRLSYGELTARSQRTDSWSLFAELAQALDRIAGLLEAKTQQLQQQPDKDEALSEIVNEFAVQHDITTLLQLIADKVMTLLNASFAAICLYDATRSDLEITAVAGLDIQPGMRIRMGEGSVGRAAETCQPFIIDQYDQWEGRLSELEPFGFTAVMQVPMVYRDELIGVLGAAEVGSTRKFTQSELQIMKLIAGTAATAVRNARLFEETHLRLQELEAINAISTALRAAQRLDEMLAILLEKTIDIAGAVIGSIWLYNPSEDALHPFVSNGIPPLTIHIKPGESILGKVFSEAQSYFTPAWREDSLVPDSLRTQIPRDLSSAFIPIRATQSTIGVLQVGFRSPHEFPEHQKRLLGTIAEIAGNAIHRIQLHERTEKQLQRLSALHEIDLAITDVPDFGNMLQILLDQVITQLHVDAACVLVVDRSQQTLEFAGSRGFTTEFRPNTHLRFGEGYASQAALTQRTIHVYIPNLTAYHSDDLSSSSRSMEDFVSYVAVPLVAENEVKGVLEIFHRLPLNQDPEWLDFLEALASQAAIMIGYAMLMDNLRRSNAELHLAYDSTLEGWSRALELRNRETKEHSQRVTEITLRLARAIGIADAELVHIRRGALLHDIGKLGIPDSILLKAGPLNEEERDLIEKHATIAFEMLAPITYLHPALDIPHAHHEKWNGTGYPRGLKGEEIPLAARIFAVADVWDALISDRPYRKARSKDEAFTYIKEQAGEHFDPKVVDVFLSLMDNEKDQQK